MFLSAESKVVFPKDKLDETDKIKKSLHEVILTDWSFFIMLFGRK